MMFNDKTLMRYLYGFFYFWKIKVFVKVNNMFYDNFNGKLNAKKLKLLIRIKKKSTSLIILLFSITPNNYY